MSVTAASTSPWKCADFYTIILELFEFLKSEFRNDEKDFASEDFLADFSYHFLPQYEGQDWNAALRGFESRLLEVIRNPTYNSSAVFAAKCFYSDHGGLTDEQYVLDMVNDFLNFALPRAADLPNEMEIFDRCYKQLDDALFGDEFELTCFAVLTNVYDNSGFRNPPSGFNFHWYSRNYNIPADKEYFRTRCVPYLEIVKSAHSIGRGREIPDKTSLYVVEYREMRKRSEQSVSEAYERSAEVIGKVVLALRLISYSDVYSDYRGFRMPGHWASHNLNLMNYPDEVIERGESHEFHGAQQIWFERFMPALLQTSQGQLEILEHKFDDILRRRRRVMLGEREAQLKSDADKLLDYCQVLEAILKVDGSYNLSLYATNLLHGSGYGGLSSRSETFDFFKDVYRYRNEIAHGRLDDFLRQKTKGVKGPLDMYLLRKYVHLLAIIFIMNGCELREAAHKLSIGETVKLNTIYS